MLKKQLIISIRHSWSTAASTPQTLLVDSICGPMAAISYLYINTSVRCSVSRPFLWLAGGLELDIKLPMRFVMFLWQFMPGPDNFSFFHFTSVHRLCYYALYKSRCAESLKEIDKNVQHEKSTVSQSKQTCMHRWTDKSKTQCLQWSIEQAAET